MVSGPPTDDGFVIRGRDLPRCALSETSVFSLPGKERLRSLVRELLNVVSGQDIQQ